MAVNSVGTYNRLRMAGLSSGLDVDEIVKQLMTAERIPLDRMLQRRQALQWQQEDYRAINSKLRAFDSFSLNMRLSGTFNPRTVASSHSDIVAVSTTANQPAGTYQIRVNSLAESASFYSGGAITKESGSPNTLAEQFAIADPEAPLEFTIANTAAQGGQPVTFSFDPLTQSIDDVVAAINNAGLGLQAFYESNSDRFFLSSTGTGAAVQITFGDPGGFLDMLKLQHTGESVVAGQVYAGVDASINFNGADLHYATNQFTINGVSYSLQQAAPATLVTVTVGRDVDSVVNSLQDFVAKYNELIDELYNKQLEKRYYDYQPLTDAQKEEMSEKEIELWEQKARSGLLKSDPLLRQAIYEIRNALTARVSDSDSVYNSLAAIGITTGSWDDNGKLYIDETQLRAALTADPAGVQALFTQKGSTAETQGIGNRLDAALGKWVSALDSRAGSPATSIDQSYLSRQIANINQSVALWEERLAAKEEKYYKQYSVLESYIANMNTQSSWLSQQFGGSD